MSPDEKKALEVTLAPHTSTREGQSQLLAADVAFTRHQHSLSYKDAFRTYAPAVAWSFLFSLGVIMAGFDPQLVGTLGA